MTEGSLTNRDIERIRIDINLGLIFAAGIVIAGLVLIGIGMIVISFFLSPKEGILTRTLMILFGGLIFYVLIISRHFLQFFELRRGKKICFTTNDFKIKRSRNGLKLVTNSPIKLSFLIHDGLDKVIDSKQSLNFEVAKLSKTLLFLSHDSENLIEKVEIEKD